MFKALFKGCINYYLPTIVGFSQKLNNIHEVYYKFAKKFIWLGKYIRNQIGINIILNNYGLFNDQFLQTYRNERKYNGYKT